MRSELIPHPLASTSESFCELCFQLGYLTNDQIDLNQSFRALNFSNADAAVVHVSFLLNPKFSKFEALVGAVKSLRYVGCIDCFSKNQAFIGTGSGGAIVAKDISEIIFAKEKFIEAEIYFHCDYKNFDFEKWTALPVKFLEKIKLFSKYQVFKNLTAVQQLGWLNLANLFNKKNITFEYENPFNHDTIEFRNTDHLGWVFEPNLIFKNLTKSTYNIIVSVIIPFHNRASFIKKIMCSLEKQTLSQGLFEVILVDDGSVESETSSNIEYIKSLNNLNVSYHYVGRKAALHRRDVENRAGPIRNLGAHVSQGTILLFLDSDILVPEDYLLNLIDEHREYDIVLPERVYLSKACSKKADGSSADFTKDNFMNTPWDEFMNKIYGQKLWSEFEYPWKYFMTYCLSIKKNSFLKTGGFRTNFLGYGYEDLELGYRILKLAVRFKIIKTKVFHLFHFDSHSEYDLFSFRRYYQLAMTARIFVMQNAPPGSHDLEKMVTFRTFRAKLYYLFTTLGKK